mmetsp:Transcript_5084/g.9573  ORF Transcript_5084/g.9573 Transcript_5084/m.9573 type:complete len:220 (-) Transcript_5084:1761-2420(-)
MLGHCWPKLQRVAHRAVSRVRVACVLRKHGQVGPILRVLWCQLHGLLNCPNSIRHVLARCHAAPKIVPALRKIRIQLEGYSEPGLCRINLAILEESKGQVVEHLFVADHEACAKFVDGCSQKALCRLKAATHDLNLPYPIKRQRAQRISPGAADEGLNGQVVVLGLHVGDSQVELGLARFGLSEAIVDEEDIRRLPVINTKQSSNRKGCQTHSDKRSDA